jgi:hypothetical protein
MSSAVNLPDAFLSIDTDSAHALRNGFANHAFENMMKGEGTSFLDEMLNAHDSHDQGHKQSITTEQRRVTSPAAQIVISLSLRRVHLS